MHSLLNYQLSINIEERRVSSGGFSGVAITPLMADQMLSYIGILTRGKLGMAKNSLKDKQASRKFWMNALAIIGTLGFLGSTTYGLVEVFRSASQPLLPTSQTFQDQAEALNAKIKGYETVLQREPSNITALEGLAQIYLETNNLTQAVPILEKLVQLQPNNSNYKTALEHARQGLAQPTSPQPPTQPSK
jgi:cytochrome c-type biogenesis protein CcmH/NrfG